MNIDAIQIKKIISRPVTRTEETGIGRLFFLRVAWREAADRWSQWSELLAPCGIQPVLVEPSRRGELDHLLFKIRQDKWRAANLSSAIDAAEEVDAACWLATNRPEISFPSSAPPIQPFLPNPALSFDLDGVPGEENILLVPAKNSWDIPAVLGFGDRNLCPRPEVHVSILRYWADRFGATLASLASERMDVVVSRPPKVHEAAIDLAWEHAAYCNETVDIAGSIENLSRSLLGGLSWNFWWD